MTNKLKIECINFKQKSKNCDYYFKQILNNKNSQIIIKSNEIGFISFTIKSKYFLKINNKLISYCHINLKIGDYLIINCVNKTNNSIIIKNIGFFTKAEYDSFDFNIYRNYYEDLKNIKNDHCLWVHWCRFGKKEGRTYSKLNNEVINNEVINNENNEVINNENNELINNENNEVINNENNEAINNEHDIVATLFHVGNYDIFIEMYNMNLEFYKRKNNLLFFSVHNETNKNKLNEIFKTENIYIIENKGMDIGGFLYLINILLNHKLYNKIKFIYKFHTKTDEKWRDEMYYPIISNYDIIEKKYFCIDIPLIFASDKFVYNNKVINRKYIKKILERNNINNNVLMDEYVLNNDNDKNNNIELFLNQDFYKEYEIDLNNFNNEQLVNHWKEFGINEFHRISNPNYIKNFSEITYFVAGTLFAFNNKYLEIFKKINLLNEYNILENGYIINDLPRKTHAWEYIFGIFLYQMNGYIISIDKNNNYKNFLIDNDRTIFNIDIYKNCNVDLYNYNDDDLITHYKKYGINENRIFNYKTLFKKQSIINIPYKKSKIAFFMLIPNDNMSGGYRTLLNYINVLLENNLNVDIYFGNSTNDMKTYKGLSIINKNIESIIDVIKSYKSINNIEQCNYYLGLNVQRNYEIIVANAWQISEAVYLNKNYAKKLFYIIQDEEYLFYPNDKELQSQVIKTYKNDFIYYCLSKYLYNKFKQYLPDSQVIESFIGVNNDIYHNLNKDRCNYIIIAYYKNKVGRMPKLVRNIIKKLYNNYVIYVFPDKYNYINHSNIINLGKLDEKTLNIYYNMCKIGIVFSNTNPSRLGFEMLSSGLNVIEYDSIFTNYDMDCKYFKKIKNDDNIHNIINEYMDYKCNMNKYYNLLNIKNEYNILLNLFKSNIF